MPYVVKSQFNDEGRSPVGIAYAIGQTPPAEY